MRLTGTVQSSHTGNKKGEKDVVQLTGQGVAADGMTFLQYRGDFFISVSG